MGYLKIWSYRLWNYGFRHNGTFKSQDRLYRSNIGAGNEFKYLGYSISFEYVKDVNQVGCTILDRKKSVDITTEPGIRPFVVKAKEEQK